MTTLKNSIHETAPHVTDVGPATAEKSAHAAQQAVNKMKPHAPEPVNKGGAEASLRPSPPKGG